LRRFLNLHEPDILCVQELRPETHAVIDAVLENHQHVDDAFEGWQRESNVYWNRDLFDLEEFGAEDIGMFEKARRLFWTRLRPKDGGETLFISTAHYTWAGNAQEKDGGVSPRYAQAQKTIEALNALVPEGGALIFMGDLNDDRHPAIPTAKGTPQVIDWMLHRGPIRPMTTEVVDFYVDDIAPSDHKPVITTYRVE
jgi:exonuclease III